MALDLTITRLIENGDSLFSARGSLMSYLQEVAEHFYPERADFTSDRSNPDWWAGLMSSEPILKRRELANNQQAMLRPDGQEWFGIHVTDTEIDDHPEARKWLEWMTKVQRRMMYAPQAQFTRAMKLVDNDWVTFGMTPLEVDIRRDRPSMIYRTHHLRDVAWSENVYGEVDTIYHKWRPTMRQLFEMFGDKVHSEVKNNYEKHPEQRVSCYRITIPRRYYKGDEKQSPRAEWMSIYVDRANDHLLEAVPYMWNRWVIPRWQMVPGSQYGWSPCTGPGLNDARTIQAIWRVLLEAGEKAVDPPMAAVEEALRSDIGLMSGGMTFLSADYDERSGAAVRQLIDNPGAGLPMGMAMEERLNFILHEGFFLNKIGLPELNKDMTAYETRKRYEEHLRAEAPLIAPAEDEINAKVCEKTFEVAKLVNAFGPEDAIPDIIARQEMHYEFTSPLREMHRELDARRLMEIVDMALAVSQIDPMQTQRIDWDKAFEGAVRNNGTSAEWIRSDEEFQAKVAELQQQQNLQEAMGAISGGAAAAKDAAGAQKLLTDQQAS